MGRQIQLYILPEDLEVFEECLRQKGDVLFISDASHEPHPKILTKCERSGDMGTWIHYYLARTIDRDSIILEHISDKAGWSVDDRRSPVIQIDAGFFDGKILRRGRIFYDTGYYGDDGNWVSKPSDFIKWAESITKMARKLYKRKSEFDAYLGQHAEEWLIRTNGQLVI